MTTRLLVTVFVSGLASACIAPDECAPGETRCNTTGASVEAQFCANDCSDFGCRYAWGTSVCSSSGGCVVAPAEGALCVLSATPDPRCAGAKAFCDGNDRIVCRAGYAVERSACGIGADAMLPLCIDAGGDAACIPAAAAPDASCPTGRSRYCSASQDLVECIGGDAVFRSSCAVCSAASTRPCAGFLGDVCTSNTDCATGFVCHADALGRKICTTTCSVTASGDDCFGKLGTGGLPFSRYAEISPPGGRLVCVAGYCTWD
jgi:hypothetical protein